MRLDGLAGQPRAVLALCRAFDSGRFQPSLIFHGPPGVGKLTAAVTLARALLCTAKDDAPCGLCSACRRVDDRSNRHPDLRVVFPEKLDDFRKGEGAEEGVSGIDLQERQAAAVRNPVWSILIDRIRDAIGFVRRRPAEGTRSILVVDQAQRMGQEAANALLKTLEEPPDHAVMILLTPSWHSLLPTIRSRCQAVAFQSVPAAVIADWLTTVHALPPDEARLRAALAGGRMGAAADLDLDAFRARREALLQMLESFLRPPDPGRAVARAEEIAKGGESSEGDLDILVSLLRDRMIAGAAGSAVPGLIHADILPRLQTLPVSDADGGTAPLAALETALEGVRRKGNRQLLIENAFLELLAAGGPARPPR
ncbi:MAG TPA: DNA polymerase III subunit delta' [Patescibacteria group bacterium]|nr:DNA polymerase III subunit delta' [Patescibacteria group bacterium]